MRILVATDAVYPQVNGVVRTYERLALELRAHRVELIFLTPGDFRTLSFPPYPGYLIALTELIDIDRGPDPRVKYAYPFFRLAPQGSVWGYHRDPVNHPEMIDHFHPDPDTRIARSTKLHLGDVLDHGWATVSSFFTIR